MTGIKEKLKRGFAPDIADDAHRFKPGGYCLKVFFSRNFKISGVIFFPGKAVFFPAKMMKRKNIDLLPAG